MWFVAIFLIFIIIAVMCVMFSNNPDHIKYTVSIILSFFSGVLLTILTTNIDRL